jgi:hypothetical protein
MRFEGIACAGFVAAAFAAAVAACSSEPGAASPPVPDAGVVLPPVPPPPPDDGGTDAAPDVPATPRTFVALYVVGSDLEDNVINSTARQPDEEYDLPAGTLSPYGAGSDDFREIVEAYKALSTEQQKSLGFLVGFGGARKASWRGIRYADIDCLVADAADDIFGNHTCYSFKDETANMASAATLEAFLARAKTESAGYDKKILDLWNHGGAYKGIGTDTNQVTYDIVTLPELQAALTGSGTTWDILGMDACLMATLEVAVVAKPFAKYFVASEETEPGHGWDYKRIIDFLGKNSSATPQDVGKAIVDSLLDGTAARLSPATQARADYPHSRTGAKTLSVVDLSKVDDVVSKLDTLVNGIGTSFAVALQAFQETQNFGNVKKNGVEYSIDVKHFAQRVAAINSALASEAAALSTAVDAAVTYKRNDGVTPDANGLAIYTPLNTKFWNYYNSQSFVSAPWMLYLGNFVNNGTADTSKPSLGTETDNGVSRSIDFSDDKGIERAYVVLLEATGNPDVFNAWGMKDAPISASTAGNLGHTYTIDKWNGSWLSLCNGACTGSNGVHVPAFFAQKLPNGNVIYEAEAAVRATGQPPSSAQDVVVRIVVSPANTVVDAWYVPYLQVGNEVILEKEQLKPGQGLTVAFYHVSIDVASDTETYVLGPDLALSAAPQWGYGPLSATLSSLYYVLVAEDFRGNSQNSTVFSVQ